MGTDSALMTFLKEEYPKHLGIKEGEEVEVQRNVFGKGEFSFLDEKKEEDKDKGLYASVIKNDSDMPFEVIQFESYIDKLRMDNRTKHKDCGKKCDLVIGPVEGFAFILFNELTYAWETAINTSYTDRKTGKRVLGKRLKAYHQLEASIKRFDDVGDLLDEYKRKIALFSYRLKDEDSDDDGAKRMKLSPSIEDEISDEDPLPHDFIFIDLKYPTPYLIP